MADFIRCNLSTIPLRYQAGDREELVTQLIYGEDYRILERHEKWWRVECRHDQYQGWVAAEQILPRPAVDKSVVLKALGSLETEVGGQLLSPGSRLTPDEASRIRLMGRPIESASMAEIAEHFLGTSYLWGGRSVFGIDCSGLVQTVGRLAGLDLPRDASQQVSCGDPIEFGDHRQDDLAFFQNAQGNITHIGILKAENTIIHASGWVRMDDFNAQGISRRTDGIHSHQLHSIRRIKV